MLKIFDSKECPGATASSDPWIPLTIHWEVSLIDGPLYLYLTGDEGGFVELKVDPGTGVLCGLVVIDLPPAIDRVVDEAPADLGRLSPVLGLDLWEWKVTPDYKEPSRRDVDMASALRYSTPENLFALWFSDAPVSRYLECGDTRVGVSWADEMVGIVVQRPPVVRPPGAPGGLADYPWVTSHDGSVD